MIRLSPKKTWEGFIGGFISTFIFAFFFAGYLAQSSWMICPFNEHLDSCGSNPIFFPVTVGLPPAATGFISWVMVPVRFLVPSFDFPPVRSISLFPIQLHALVYAMFASFIAPFGGFFASGVKRAFKIKDFSDSIPGHGGLTDRMDCQFGMGVFSFMYYQSFIATRNVTVGSVLQEAVTFLSNDQILDLVSKLTEYLVNQGVER